MNIIYPSTMNIISDKQRKEELLELKDDTDNKNIAMLTFMWGIGRHFYQSNYCFSEVKRAIQEHSA